MFDRTVNPDPEDVRVATQVMNVRAYALKERLWQARCCSKERLVEDGQRVVRGEGWVKAR